MRALSLLAFVLALGGCNSTAEVRSSLQPPGSTETFSCWAPSSTKAWDPEACGSASARSLEATCGATVAWPRSADSSPVVAACMAKAGFVLATYPVVTIDSE